MFSFLDDHSRVKLSLLQEDPSSDYINACFIDVSDTEPLLVHGTYEPQPRPRATPSISNKLKTKEPGS